MVTLTLNSHADLIRFLENAGTNPGDAATEMLGLEVFRPGNYVKPQTESIDAVKARIAEYRAAIA